MSVWILSAKYGLIRPNDVIEPYDLKLGQPGAVEAKDLFDQLAARKFSPDYLRQVFVLLGGSEYRSVARKALESYGVSAGMIVEPFKGLEIGQLQGALKASIARSAQ